MGRDTGTLDARDAAVCDEAHHLAESGSCRDAPCPTGAASTAASFEIVPAWRRARLRARLADAELQGRLGEPQGEDEGRLHRALRRRWERGAAAGRAGIKSAATPAPNRLLVNAVARDLGRIADALASAGADGDQQSLVVAAVAQIRGVTAAVAAAASARGWRPPSRGKRRPGVIRHVAAGRRAALVDEAVRVALPGWRDGEPLPRGAVPAVYAACRTTCGREGFPRPSRGKLRRWLARRAQGGDA